MKAALCLLACCLPAAFFVSCLVYEDDLLGDDTANTGGTGSGASPSGGGNSGGTDPGGNEGGEGPTGGGNGSGASPGTGGTGGNTDPEFELLLVNDFADCIPLFGGRFPGEIGTYKEANSEWDNEEEMVAPRPDEPSNCALNARGTLGGDDWGMGFFISLNNYDSVDFSEYEGIRLLAYTPAAKPLSLTIGLEDVNSRAEEGGTVSHVGTTKGVNSVWKEIFIPFEELSRLPPRLPTDPPVDLSKIYSIHFQVKKPVTEFDLWIDDIYLYKSKAD